MKKILLTFTSIALVAGAVNSCTFGSDLEPVSGKKYITEFNVGQSSKSSDAETKTLFDIETGQVFWESGTDKLIFVKKDPTGAYAYSKDLSGYCKGFVCTESSEDFKYKFNKYWNIGKFKLLDPPYKDGLEVGEEYFAYYYPAYSYNPSDAGKIPVSPDNAIKINKFYQNGQDEESFINFMRDNDLLQLADGEAITISDPMQDIYMDHIFAIITVHLHWNGAPDDWNGQADFPFTCVKVGSNDPNPFITAFYLDGYGKWAKTDSDQNLVETYRSALNEGNSLCLGSENNVITYFFLVKGNEPVNNFWVNVYGENYPTSFSELYPRTILFTLKDNKKFTFESGKLYTIDLNAEFKDMQANTADEWQNKGKLSVTYPDDWRNMDITEYGN